MIGTTYRTIGTLSLKRTKQFGEHTRPQSHDARTPLIQLGHPIEVISNGRTTPFPITRSTKSEIIRTITRLPIHSPSPKLHRLLKKVTKSLDLQLQAIERAVLPKAPLRRLDLVNRQTQEPRLQSRLHRRSLSSSRRAHLRELYHRDENLIHCPA